MPLVYCVYGLRVLCDEPIPGLLPCDSADGIDVRVWLNRMPPWWENHSPATDVEWYRTPGLDDRGRPRLTVWKLNRSWYRLLYCDGTEFLVDPRGGELWSRWPPGATVEDSATYLVGPVLGFVLRLREVCCLHASAISIGHKIIGFSGPPHAGKSTIAAAFAKLGYAVVSDDILALEEEEDRFLVRPGYPRLCLWPDATTSLYGSSHRLPRITPEDGINDWWDKRYLDLTSSGHGFQMQSLPLSAIYLIEERKDSADCPRVEPVSASAAVVKLAANTYMNYLLDRNLRFKEFQFLTRLVSGLPVRRVIPHSDPAGLPRLCEAILQDHTGLPDTSGVMQEPQIH
jgi:hypothetical protein